MEQLAQDLHMHTTYSKFDSSIVPEQTMELIAAIKHAKIIGISDHFENLTDEEYSEYRQDCRIYGFHIGFEVDGAKSIPRVLDLELPDYCLYHCRNFDSEYSGLEELLSNVDFPVIISHPNAFDTNLDRVPKECLVEINNRYIWRGDFRQNIDYLRKFQDKFNFVISSDAHQPFWLNQVTARKAADILGVEETILF